MSCTNFKLLTHKLLTLFLGIFLLLIITLILPIIFTPFILFRHFLKKSAKCFRPDLSKILTVPGTPFAPDILNPEPKLSVVSALVFQGTLDLDLLKDIANRSLLKGTLPNGEMRWPELQQYLTPWMGYFFWKDDPSFHIDRHVQLCNSKVPICSEEEMHEIFEKLLQKPWDKNRPLWDMNILQNYFPDGGDIPHTVMFFRNHHTLADGYSMFNLVWNGLSETKVIPPNAVPEYFKPHFFKTLCFWLTFPVMGSLDLAQSMIESIPQMSFNPFKPKHQDEKFLIGVADKIQISRVKDFKKHFRVSFFSVISAVCTGALRDIMNIKNMKVAGVVRSATVIAASGHSEKLRNKVAAGLLRIPTGEVDASKRLEFCHKDYQRLKRSAGIIMGTKLSRLGGFLPSWVLGRMLNINSSAMTSAINSFPGGFERISMAGCKCVDSMFAAGLGPLGISFCLLSYVDGLRIVVISKESVMTREEVNQVTRLLQKHVDMLHANIVEDNTRQNESSLLMA